MGEMREGGEDGLPDLDQEEKILMQEESLFAGDVPLPGDENTAADLLHMSEGADRNFCSVLENTFVLMEETIQSCIDPLCLQKTSRCDLEIPREW